MTILKSVSIDLRSGPLVAAMGAIAAGTLVAATMLGQSLGPIPAENPAIAILPGTGAGAPLILNVDDVSPGAEPALDPTTITAATSLGLFDATFPPKAASAQPITSLTEEETTEPVPPDDGALDRVQRAVSDIVGSLTVGVQPNERSDERRPLKTPKRTLKKAARSVGSLVPGVGALDVEPVQSIVTEFTADAAPTTEAQAQVPSKKESETTPVQDSDPVESKPATEPSS